jgi:4,5:9,10-diseco-3-hydroxy-5,9,17-trioxoandrosta-1(10),2-diene-4-oate hydrolase
VSAPARAAPAAGSIPLARHGSGRAVLLLHGGGPGNSADLTWHAVAAAMPGGFEMLAADLPGTPARQTAARLAAILAELGLRHVVVAGHSSGGRVACHLASLAPDRVDRLVVLSAGALSPDGNRDAGGELTARVQRVLGFAERARDLAEYEALWAETVVDPGTLDHARITAAYLRWSAAARSRPLAEALDQHRREQEEVWAILPGLRQPALLLWGREDDSAPWRRAGDLLDVLPDAELRVIPAAGHMLVWDRPGAVAAAIAGFARRDGD